MEISVVIRFKNEEQYIDAVLSAVSSQHFPAGEFEIIGVDNSSSDRSAEIFSRYAARVIKTEDYRPGKALNKAINISSAKYICVLSAHTIPANVNWLRTLHRHMETPRLAGVYGAQLYPVHSRFLDKRDLDIFSTLTPRVETQDSDLWNANAMFPRALWEQQPFDETVFELEDHYWTKQVLPRGYIVHFEPQALVYHYSHIKRLDRVFLPHSDLPEKMQMEAAMEKLAQPEPDWPTAMNAGLTLNSLCHLDNIEKAVHSIGRQLVTHSDFDVRWRMAQALGKIRTEASVHYLVEALSDPSFYARDETSWALARLGALAVDHVLARIPSLNAEELPFAALALGKSGVPSAEAAAVDLFLSEMATDDVKRKIDAVYFAGEIGGAVGSDRLFARFSELLPAGDAQLQMVCCWALGRFFEATALRSEEIRATLQQYAETHNNLLVRFEALVACGHLAMADRSLDLLQWLSDRLGDSEGRICFGAAQCLRLAAEKGMLSGISLPDKIGIEDFGTRYEFGLIEGMKNKS
jgi:hypothetical protein